MEAMQELLAWLKEAAGMEEALLPQNIPRPLLTALAALREKLDCTQKQLEETQDLLHFYQASANAMPNPIFIKDEELRFVFFNSAYREFFDLKDDGYIGKRVLDLEYIPPEDRERYQREDSELVASQSSLQYETAFHINDGDASESLYWSKGFKVPETERCGLIGEIVDISNEKRVQRELMRSMQALELLANDAKMSSKTDPGTKLYNRRILLDEAPGIIKEAQEENRPVCAMLMDIDYFKQINDEYGHLLGDEILEKFARLLERSFRKSDVIIRYGGDEFIVILPGAQLPQAKEIGHRLCAAVHAELLLPGGKPATISVGVTQLAADDDLLRLLSRADEALYLAKRSGRDCVATATKK